MNLTNAVPEFLELYEANSGELTLSKLQSYFEKYPDIFGEYFTYHCPRTEERLSQALQKYVDVMNNISKVNSRMPVTLKNVLKDYEDIFDFKEELQFNLFVGAFGSNAFVERKLVGDIYFAAEKLSPEKDHLRVIAAHEIGHIFHNWLSDKKGMDWKSVKWEHGLTTLYREGIATYASKRITPTLHESIYYTYDNDGDSWLTFYRENKQAIKEAFLEDAEQGWDMKKEKEWFRLFGGNYFGYNRLGYFLGTSFVEDLVDEIGENEALTYWTENKLDEKIKLWLRS